MVQFPVREEARFRTILHRPEVGDAISYSDPDFAERAWELAFENLTDEEWDRLEQLFIGSAGSARGFTFLDPSCNLLAWSEGLDEDVWQNNGVGVTGGLPDPLGGNAGFALTTGAGGGTLSQSIEAPAQYHYSGSIWARTASSGVVVRVHDGQGVHASRAFEPDNLWRRYEVGYAGLGSGESVHFEVSALGTAALDVFGPQLEAQIATSAYKRSSPQGGVFSNARFDQQVLRDQLVGPQRHSTKVRILWTPSLA
ncbi:MAG: hypothetical protein GC160_19500 [Acidobacteria bacterium]|nr:hypothetical protein [Acidobacteriota bacterium]